MVRCTMVPRLGSGCLTSQASAQGLRGFCRAVGVVESGVFCGRNELSDALVIQQPPAVARQLFLLFHGVGGQAQDMAGLGQRLAQAFPEALVASLPGPLASDLGAGRQWFSVRGIDEANRPERVAQALPGFLAEVRRWQARSGLAPEATALVGFSQGAILALEASKQEPLVAGRIVGLAGRFAQLPERLPEHCTVHLVHGKADAVMPCALTVQAAEHLVAVGADVTADVLPFVGHAITEEMVALVLERLQGYIPQARWREALAAAQEAGPPGQSD